MKAPSVCLVTQWFPPEPAKVAEWLALSLRDLGWIVNVLTGIPNYPDGRVYPGFRAYEFRSDIVVGLDVRRTPLFPSHDSSPGRRMLNYSSWAISATLGGMRDLIRSDVALVYSSPATAALPAMVARVLFRRPFVLMIQDLWPDSVFSSGFLTGGSAARVARAALGSFTRLSYRLAGGVAVISPGMIPKLLERGVDTAKVQLVFNWVDESIFHPAAPDSAFRTALGIAADDFVVMYAGNHGAAQDLSNVIQAMRLLSTGRVVHLVLVGDGIEKRHLLSLVGGSIADRVHFLPPRPRSLMAELMASADIQLVSLKDDPLFHITMPSKVQSILASGCAILVCAPGDARQVALDAGAGFACDPGDPGALAEAIRQAADCQHSDLERMGANALRYYHMHMAQAIGAERLSTLLNRAMVSLQEGRIGK